MSTHDYNIANQTALNFRGDLNDALEAIVSTNSNATAPTTTYQYMWWYDTTNDLLKMRDESNSAWITLGYVDQSNLNFQPYIGGTQVTEVLDEDDMASDSDTGVPTQQSVKAYVDALDTTVDGVDVKNRYYPKVSVTSGYATFSSLGGVKSFTVMYEIDNLASSNTLYVQTSADGGSSWSTARSVRSMSSSGGYLGRVFIDTGSGNWWDESEGWSQKSLTTNADTIRFYLSQYSGGSNTLEVGILIEEGVS